MKEISVENTTENFWDDVIKAQESQYATLGLTSTQAARLQEIAEEEDWG